MKCDYCDSQFVDNMNGVTTMTFHVIIRHGDILDG